MAEAQSRPSRRMGKSTSPDPPTRPDKTPKKASDLATHGRPAPAARQHQSALVTAAESLTAAATRQITLASAATAGTTGHAMVRPAPGAPAPAAL